MTCKFNSKKAMRVMLIAGLVMLLCGAVAAHVIGEEGSSLAMRIAGFFSGIGGSFAAMGAFVLIRRRVIGEARATDAEREMSDERGQMIALKAQNVFALTATLGIVALIVTAMIRDDTFYMFFGTCLCFALCLAKGIALHVYGKRL